MVIVQVARQKTESGVWCRSNSKPGRRQARSWLRSFPSAEAGVKYSGVLCGRATWQNAIPVYANEGVAALEGWLAERGLQNIQALNNVLALGAVPWWDAYGGKGNIEIIK